MIRVIALGNVPDLEGTRKYGLGIHVLRQSVLPYKSHSSLLLSRPIHKKLYTKNRSNYINSGKERRGNKQRRKSKRKKIWVLRNQAQGQKYSKQQVQKYTARQHRVIRVITPIGGKGIERIKQDKGDTKEPLEHRPVGTDHDRWFFRVWSGDFGDFTATLLQSLESCME